MLESFFFYFFAFSAVIFSLAVIFLSQPILSALSLLMVLVSIAGVYALLGAHLLAGLQILVYAGAVLVLFIFVIMLLDPKEEKKFYMVNILKASSLAGALIGVFAFLLFTLPNEFPSQGFTQDNISNLGGNTKVLSMLLFSDYLLPFELTSFLLLAAIVGAVSIAKRKGHVVYTEKGNQ